MVQALHLYIDDSGSRHPDREPRDAGANTWFGLGGVLLRESDEGDARGRFDAFRTRWAMHLHEAPLHSHEIRQRKGPFAWLKTSEPEESAAFFAGIGELIAASPILCTACVIDRSGYMARYLPKYDASKRWALCKTAFSVLLERAVKYALREKCLLRVFVERSDKATDARMLAYYDELREVGMPFAPSSMASYLPLEANAFRNTLYDFKTKNKSSPMMQLADVCLYPICRAGYDRTGRDYQSLVVSRKLIDCVVPHDDVRFFGVKYSCFDSVARNDVT
jgi:hypothetical protein